MALSSNDYHLSSDHQHLERVTQNIAPIWALTLLMQLKAINIRLISWFLVR
jgi:hypothetical protein